MKLQRHCIHRAAVFGLFISFIPTGSALADLMSAIEAPATVTSSGDQVWGDQSVTTHDAVDAAQSGAIGNSESTTLSTTVTGPASVSFWWKISSESGFDPIKFSVDGGEQFSISGEVDWEQRTVVVGAGSHTLDWTYQRDPVAGGGSNTAWVDELQVTPLSPPANDDFADRVTISGASPTTTGDNTAASLEGTEPDLGTHDGASVWWTWTAPATGWVCVDTDGSAIPTTVAVFTGSDIGSLTKVAWGSGSFFDPQARIYLEAVAGTAYQIAVHGDPSSTMGVVPFGALSLEVDSTYSPPADLIAFAMTPQTGDVGSGPVPITLDFTVTTNAPFDHGSVSIVGADQSFFKSTSFDANQRQSGTTTNGVYQVSASVPGYLNPGDLTIEVQVVDDAHNHVEFSNGCGPGTDHAKGGFGFTFAATNTGTVDSAAPAVASLSVTPATVDVFGAGQTVNVDLTITDAETGMAGGSVDVFDPSGGFSQSLFINQFHRTSGDEHSGDYRVPVTIPQGAQAGTWRVEVTVFDLLNNTRTYGQFGEPIPGGSSAAEIEVTNVYPLEDAIDTDTATITTSGDADWFGQVASSNDGVDSARSGAIGDGETSVMSTTVVGPAEISFWWKTSTQSGDDWLRFYLGGSVRSSRSGSGDWSMQTFTLGAGSHLLEWKYEKGASGSSGSDAVWVDQFVYVPPVLPPNDHFADAIVLPGAAASDTRNNTYAGLETNEPALGSYDGASLWWEWTAPATGWVKVDTAGSAIPTTLAVYTGPDIASLTLVGWNSGSGPAPRGVLTFNATAGTTYSLAVHGNPFANNFTVPEGDMSINLQSGVTPAIALNSLTLTPATVDVGTGAQTVQVDFDASAAAGLDILEVFLLKPSGDFVGKVDLDVSAPGVIQSGDKFSGSFRATVTVPGYMSPQALRLELELIDELSNHALYGDGTGPFPDHARPDLDFAVDVANTGTVDMTGAVLTSVSFSPSTVNIHSGDVAVDMLIGVDDPLSGFAKVFVSLYDGSDSFIGQFSMDTAVSAPVSGDANSGVWSVPLVVSGTGAPGTWRVEMFLRDHGHGFASYGGNFGDPFPGGASSGEFTVIDEEGGSDYASWASANGIPGEPFEGDFNNDGLPNGAGPVFGIDPVSGTGMSPLSVSTSPTGGLHLELQFDRLESLPDDVAIVIHAGDTLTGMTEVARKTGNGAWTGTATVTEGAPSAGVVPVTIADPVTGQPTRMMKVVLELVP